MSYKFFKSTGIILFILAILPLNARQWIVAESGEDFSSVQAALNTAMAGDSILVKEKSGPYFEKINFPRSGNDVDGFITLMAYPGDKPILDGTGVSNNPASYTDDIVYLEDISYVRIIGFEIRNTNAKECSGIRFWGSGTQIEIRDNEIHEIRGGAEDGGAMGITIFGSNDNASINYITIEGNHIHDCDPAWSEALTLNGNVEQFKVLGNRIEDVNNIGIDFIGGESWLSRKFARNGRCAWNEVYRANSSYEDGYAAGIYVDGGSDIILENNIVSGCDLGIEVGAENSGVVTQNITVRNNIIYQNNKNGLVFGGYASNTGRVKNSHFYGNTCYHNDLLKTGNGELWIQYAEDNQIRNNIFYANDQNILLQSEAGSVNNVLDYNLWFTDAGSSNGQFYWNGNNYNSFSAYQSGAGQDAHSLFDIPGFANAGMADFHISAASPAWELGDPAYTPVTGELDLDGEVRLVGIRVDAGADEVLTTSSSDYKRVSLPDHFILQQNYPNPFNPSTLISYRLSVVSQVDLRVYNIHGKRVQTLVNTRQGVGKYRLKFDAVNLASGIYYYKLTVNGKIQTRKMILLH